jgi:hypothetical protein
MGENRWKNGFVCLNLVDCHIKAQDKHALRPLAFEEPQLPGIAD